MKPASFEYLAPSSINEAVAALAENGDEARVLAGGQSLVPLLAFRFAQPGMLVDLNRIAELDYIRKGPDGTLAIGAMTRARTLEQSDLIHESQPLLAEAIPLVGHPQIRNRGTFGGSLAHADPAAEFPAVALALRATLVAVGPAGVREIPAHEFFRTYFTTALAQDELLLEIRIPPLPARTGCAFLELSRRHGDFALIGVAATVTVPDGRCEDAGIVLAGAGDTPMGLGAARERLRGERPSEELLEDVAATVSDSIDPGSDIHASAGYRKRVAETLVLRALRTAVDRALEAEA